VKLRSLLLCMVLLMPVALHAQGGDLGRRRALQGQIIQGFMNRVSEELELDQATRARLEQQLRASGAQRRELAQNTLTLRRQMMVAARDTTTSDADFKRMLNDMSALRQREEDLWKSDQEALARILTPRQHARFVFMWLRFNEQVREMALQPGMGPRPKLR